MFGPIDHMIQILDRLQMALASTTRLLGIAVVIDGRIAELGSHHELLDLDGDYAALWRAWTT